MLVYLDNAATTPMRKEVIKKTTQVMRDSFGNPSSTHSFGRTAKAHIETARKSIASLLNAEPQEIIFTSGGTESNNMLLRCAAKDLEVQEIITSPLEHHAILHTLERLERENVKLQYVKIASDGSVDLNHLDSLLKNDDKKRLVTLMHINNEIGNILDIESVSKLCKERHAYFHTDAVQSVGHYEVDLKSIPVDFLSASAHKFHGPKGAGFSFIRKNSRLKSFIYGGSQERGFRAGTESVHNIVGMQAALELAYQNLAKEREQIKRLKSYFLKELKAAFPEIHFNGLSENEEKGTYTLVNVALPIPSEKALLLDFHLDLKGIACSKGSACQSGSVTGSHVLNAIQSDNIKKRPSIRFSFSIFNTLEEIDYVIKMLKEFSTS